MSSSNSHREKEALTLLKEAQKMSQASSSGGGSGGNFFTKLFSSSSTDWSEVADKYVEAGNIYKELSLWREAGDAFIKASDCASQDKDMIEGPRYRVTAATCYKKIDPLLAIVTLQDTIPSLLKQGRFDAVARHELEIAELFENQLDDPIKAREAYSQAARRYEGEDNKAHARKCHLKVALLSSVIGEYKEAARFWEEGARDSVTDDLRRYEVRDALLHSGLCRLADASQQNDVVGAKRVIEGYCTIDPSFLGTRENKLLSALLASLEDSDATVFEEGVQDYDKVNSMDPWRTKLLLIIKKGIISQDTANPVAIDGDDEFDLT